MKPLTFLILSYSTLLAFSLHAGDFINLGFENPDLTHARPSFDGSVYASSTEILQGWTLFEQSDPSHTPITTYVSVGSFIPSTLQDNSHSIILPGFDIFGKYGLTLNADWFSSPVYQLGQTGMIPVGANSLRFYYGQAFHDPPLASRFQCLINGESVNIKSAPSIRSIFDADVSKWAGQKVDLEFVFGNELKIHDFDIAGFVSTPEPSAYALLGVGLGILCWFGRTPKSHLLTR